jgi:DNA-directed RNA polymerase specialized sigma24 family protein
VLLSEAEGWSAAEIGAETGLSAGAVRVRLHRARKKLQASLRTLGLDPTSPAGDVGGERGAV